MNNTVLTPEQQKASDSINQIYGAHEAMCQCEQKQHVTLCVGGDSIYFENANTGMRSRDVSRRKLENLSTYDLVLTISGVMAGSEVWETPIGSIVE